MFEECKNTKQQGNIGLGSAIQYFSQKLYTISLPLNDSQDYDLVVEDFDGTLKKVQVKTTFHLTDYDIYCVNLCVNGGNSKINYRHKSGNDIIYDWLFVLCSNNDRYLIPKEIIKNHKRCLNLGKQYQKYKLD